MYTDSQIYVSVLLVQHRTHQFSSTVPLIWISKLASGKSLINYAHVWHGAPQARGAGARVEGHVTRRRRVLILVGGVYICLLTEGHVFAVFLAARREGSVPSRMDWHASTVPGCGAGANGRPNFAKDTLRKVWERRRSLRQVAPHLVQNSGQAGLVSAGVARILCSHVPHSERRGSLRGRTQS